MVTGCRTPGLECSGPQDAIAKARSTCVHDGELDKVSGRQLIVVDETGAEIYKVSLAISS